MQNPSRWLTRALPALAILPLAACATPIPLTKTSALEAFKTIPNSRRAPCEMQRDVAEHNSRYDSLSKGKAVTYKAPCDVDKKQPVS